MCPSVHVVPLGFVSTRTRRKGDIRRTMGMAAAAAMGSWIEVEEGLRSEEK
jgi:hypothetical protein